MRIVTGHQPVYLPWLGLFHKIALADAFVFMDDVQYLEKDWNNRNRIKGPQGPFWLTVPVCTRRSPSRLLKDIAIASDGFGTASHWQNAHWRSLQSCYGKAPYWADHASFFEQLYRDTKWEWLAELSEVVLRYCLEALHLPIEFIKASEMAFDGRKSDLVLDHCRRLSAGVCVLGTHGKAYLVEEDFFAEGVSVYYQDYQHPTYPQRFGPFCPNLSAVDLLFNCGADSLSVLLAGNVRKSDLTGQARRSGRAGRIDLAVAEGGVW